MRIYVTGCGGMLGDAVYKYLSERHKILATDIVDCSVKGDDWLKFADVRNHGHLHYDVSDFRPDVILNLAAITSLEKCELYPDEAVETNVGGSAHCAAIASKFGIPYVYISTAGIFDGKKERYDEMDTPNPLCVYGKTKYYGEVVARSIEKHIVLRCGWQMGSGHKDKKFINKIWKQIKDGATELNVVTDKLGTPTYVKDFTLQIEKLIEHEAYGVWNAACKGEASRYDVAVEFVRLLGLQDQVKVNKVDSSFWAKEYFAVRPPSEKLITDRLDRTGLNVMRPWQEALAEYVKEYSDYFRR
jgi:dTDP-4-dehydrorhamnose reductase